MSTTFLFCLPYHGHINPCVPIVEELTRRGERVVAFTTEEFRGTFERAGAQFRLLPYEESRKGEALLTMVHWQLQVCNQCMGALVQEARREGVAYIMVDYLCHWGHVLAQHLGVPLIVLHSTYPNAFRNISVLRSILMDLWNVPSLLPELFRFMLLDRRFAKKWRVSALGLPMRLIQRNEGAAHIALTHEWMQPEKADATHRYHFVGPCIRRAGSTKGEPLPPPDGRPLVYISLGTFWNQRADFYMVCVEAFRDAPFQVLISVGPNFDIEALGPLPENIHVRRHVDQIAALKRAALFLSHGGMNSLCEAVEARVPLLLFPQAADQFALSELMERRGIAALLRSRDLSAQGIRAASERAMQDFGIRKRLSELRGLTNVGHAARRAVDIIFKTNTELTQERPWSASQIESRS